MGFLKMSESQSAIVNALLDGLPEDGWVMAYLHSEFRDADDSLIHFEQGFVAVQDEGRLERLPLPVEASVASALGDLFRAYAESGQSFARLDLIVEPSGKYRLELDHTPSLVLA